jgi:hypothetical protein
MAADGRLSEVEAFVRQHLEAEAALTVAALGEPDDDAYLGVERQAKAFYAPSSTPLGPLESRWATPGGTSPQANVDVTGSVRPAALYGIGSIDLDTWIALIGQRRDLDGRSIAEALLIRRTTDGLRIVGRAAVDPFATRIKFEPAGGESVDVGLAGQVEILREPTSPEHAEFLRRWGRS